MANNTIIGPSAVTDVVRSLDKAGVKTQVVALDLGGTGAESLASGSLPVTGPLTDTQLRATAVPVSGAFYQATQPVSIASMPSTPVTGTFWQTTQPVSFTWAGLTDTQLRATPVPVSGTFYQATQPVSGSVSVSNFPATQPVSGTFWQATQPVSIAGTVTVSNGQTQPLTDTQLRASAVPVSLTSLPALTTGSATIGAVTGPGAAALALDSSISGHKQTFQAVTAITALSAANAAVTLTIPAAGAGLFTYITRIRITLHNTSATAVAGSAVTLAFTSTNIPGSLAWTEGNALAAGTSKVVCDESINQPLKTTTVNTATTIVAPAAGAGVFCRITAYYYTAA